MAEVEKAARSADLEKALSEQKISIPKFTDAVQAQIEAGNIALDLGEANAKVGDKKASKLYVKTVPCGDAWLAGALALHDGDQDKVADRFAYGHDLKFRASLRPALVALLEGPKKIIARCAKDLVAAGLADTEEEALEMVIKGRKDRGLEV